MLIFLLPVSNICFSESNDVLDCELQDTIDIEIQSCSITTGEKAADNQERVLSYSLVMAVSQQLYRILQSLAWSLRVANPVIAILLQRLVQLSDQLLANCWSERKDDGGHRSRADLLPGDDYDGISSSSRQQMQDLAFSLSDCKL